MPIIDLNELPVYPQPIERQVQQCTYDDFALWAAGKGPGGLKRYTDGQLIYILVDIRQQCVEDLKLRDT